MKNHRLVFTNARGKVVKKPASAPIQWRISAYALIRSENRILMIRDNESRKWELPGGGVELNETIARGIVRECYEETGYRVRSVGDPVYLIEKYFYSDFWKSFYHAVSLIYNVQLVHKKRNKAAINADTPGEVLEVAWQPIADFKKLDCHPMFKPFLKTLR